MVIPFIPYLEPRATCIIYRLTGLRTNASYDNQRNPPNVNKKYVIKFYYVTYLSCTSAYIFYY